VPCSLADSFGERAPTRKENRLIQWDPAVVLDKQSPCSKRVYSGLIEILDE